MDRHQNISCEKWCLLGSSRGLGRAFALMGADLMGKNLEIFSSSRKMAALEQLKLDMGDKVKSCDILACDFTNKSQREELLNKLEDWKPHRLFYFAGGGPFGAFEAKEWKDHQWAYELNLLFPAQLLHRSFEWPELKQWILIGSAIADAKPDPNASSYSSAKHGLRGLVESLKLESKRDIRFFSPGYMDTSLLPPQARVRQTHKVESTEAVAELILAQILTHKEV